MSVDVTSSDFTGTILSDLGVTVSYYAVTNSVDPITGENSRSFASAVEKTWVFYKRGSSFSVSKFGVDENADAYLFCPVADTLSVGDRVGYDGELFEVAEGSKDVSSRYMGSNALFNYYTLVKVG